MNFSHAFFKVHTVIFHRCNANISTGCQRPTFFPDFSSGSNFAKAGNILIGSLAELLIEPLGVFGDSQNFLFFCDSKLPCGSASISNTFLPVCASPTPRLTVVVVFPTPPFWFVMAITLQFSMRFPPFSII